MGVDTGKGESRRGGDGSSSPNGRGVGTRGPGVPVQRAGPSDHRDVRLARGAPKFGRRVNDATGLEDHVHRATRRSLRAMGHHHDGGLTLTIHALEQVEDVAR